ncbi:MAG: hypothetical protein P4L99_12805 [Chthoniobacter sp.]|nr:hypothetical protein [Chthoniobacter sp.]
MKHLAPGLRELGRISDRLLCRLRLVRLRRTLAQLEGKLGLLGWQQADYGPGTQEHVDRVTDVERTQVRLTNESATLGLTVQQLEERRTSERATFESQRTARLAAREPLAAPVAESERALGAKQKEGKEIEERVSTLDRERNSAEEKYRLLLAKGDHMPGEAAEVLRLQQRVISVPLEKKEWQEKLAAVQVEIVRLEAELEQRRALLSVETEALRVLEKSFAESDAALVSEIATHKRDKQKLEKQVDALEKSKTQSYREIGRALADQQIEPLNQPEALTAVLAHRERVAGHEARVAASREESGQEKRVDVWTAWVLLLIFAVIVFGGTWLLLRSR